MVPPFLPVKIWSRVFQSRVFHPRTFHGPPFSIPAFSASPLVASKDYTSLALPHLLKPLAGPSEGEGRSVEEVSIFTSGERKPKAELRAVLTVWSVRVGLSALTVTISASPRLFMLPLPIPTPAPHTLTDRIYVHTLLPIFWRQKNIQT